MVRTKGITKVHKNRWFTQSRYEEIRNMNNPTRDDYNKEYFENPSHSIEKGIKKIKFFNDLITDDKDIRDTIKTISDPIHGVSEFGFIELRYKSVEEIENINEIFNKWNECFIKLLSWINDNTRNIEVEKDD